MSRMEETAGDQRGGGVKEKKRIIFYIPVDNEAGRQMLLRLLPLASDHPTEILRTRTQLESFFTKPRPERVIAVLAAADQEELSDLLALSPLFHGTAVILVLPDLLRGTLSKAHAMGARFLSEMDGDFEDVAAVLPKMLTTP